MAPPAGARSSPAETRGSYRTIRNAWEPPRGGRGRRGVSAIRRGESEAPRGARHRNGSRLRQGRRRGLPVRKGGGVTARHPPPSVRVSGEQARSGRARGNRGSEATASARSSSIACEPPSSRVKRDQPGCKDQPGICDAGNHGISPKPLVFHPESYPLVGMVTSPQHHAPRGAAVRPREGGTLCAGGSVFILLPWDLVARASSRPHQGWDWPRGWTWPLGCWRK